jgi:hypothetical protein
MSIGLIPSPVIQHPTRKWVNVLPSNDTINGFNGTVDEKKTAEATHIFGSTSGEDWQG